MTWCRVQWKGAGKKKDRKSKKTEKKKDLYGLLGLQDVRWMATDSQLKKAYQKQALKHHPDKACRNVDDPSEKERLEEKFKAIQVCTLAVDCALIHQPKAQSHTPRNPLRRTRLKR